MKKLLSLSLVVFMAFVQVIGQAGGSSQMEEGKEQWGQFLAGQRLDMVAVMA